MWNVVIIEARHEQQIFPLSAIEKLDANGRDVGDFHPVVVIIVMRRHRDNKAK
jgi:hypothetical protein